MKTILVCGGRDFSSYKTVERVLDILVQRFDKNDLTIIEGGAPGADRMAGMWALRRGIWHASYRAKWEDLSHPDAAIRIRANGSRYDAMAGHRRNQQMLDEGKPDLVVAFPGGTGTADMVRLAKRAGVEVIEVTENFVDAEERGGL